MSVMLDVWLPKSEGSDDPKYKKGFKSLNKLVNNYLLFPEFSQNSPRRFFAPGTIQIYDMCTEIDMRTDLTYARKFLYPPLKQK